MIKKEIKKKQHFYRHIGTIYPILRLYWGGTGNIMSTCPPPIHLGTKSPPTHAGNQRHMAGGGGGHSCKPQNRRYALKFAT